MGESKVTLSDFFLSILLQYYVRVLANFKGPAVFWLQENSYASCREMCFRRGFVKIVKVYKDTDK